MKLKKPFEFQNGLHKEFHKEHGIVPYDNSNNKEQLLQYIIWLEERLLEKSMD